MLIRLILRMFGVRPRWRRAIPSSFPKDGAAAPAQRAVLPWRMLLLGLAALAAVGVVWFDPPLTYSPKTLILRDVVPISGRGMRRGTPFQIWRLEFEGREVDAYLDPRARAILGGRYCAEVGVGLIRGGVRIREETVVSCPRS